VSQNLHEENMSDQINSPENDQRQSFYSIPVARGIWTHGVTVASIWTHGVTVATAWVRPETP